MSKKLTVSANIAQWYRKNTAVALGKDARLLMLVFWLNCYGGCLCKYYDGCLCKHWLNCYDGCLCKHFELAREFYPVFDTYIKSFAISVVRFDL